MAAPFKKNVVIALGVLTAISFLAGLIYAMLGPGVQTVDSVRANTFSRSAVGHHALLTLLKAVDVPVSVSRARTAEKAGAGTVLILLEPRRTAEDPTAGDLPALLRDSGASDVIVVLPKWSPRGRSQRAGWVKRVESVRDQRVADVLTAARLDSTLVEGDGAFVVDAFDGLAPQLSTPRVLTGIHGVVSDGKGALVGQTQAFGKRIWIISDPDVLNNAGLLDAQNAAFVLALLQHIVGERAVVIDETLHGFSIVEGVWPRLFEFPLVLTTAQVALVLVLVLLAGMRRFGPPAAQAPALGQGREVLISNTARLLWYGGHSAAALDQFWRATLKTVRQGVHAPVQLEGEALWAWLDRVGLARGVLLSATAISADVAAIDGEDGAKILSSARFIAQWRAQMLAEG
ncbi:MAG: hypothetical protein ACI9U2_005230 [Bradymonadia bacterium]|jgi:hypothetical protein